MVPSALFNRLEHGLYGPICCWSLQQVVLAHHSNFKLISLVNPKKVKNEKVILSDGTSEGTLCSAFCVCLLSLCCLFLFLVSLSRSTNSSQEEKYISISLSKWKVLCFVFHNLHTWMVVNSPTYPKVNNMYSFRCF